MDELKELAIAYELACEFDYCPDNLAEARRFYGKKVTQSILDKHSGSRPDELARMLVTAVLQ